MVYKKANDTEEYMAPLQLGGWENILTAFLQIIWSFRERQTININYINI